MCREIFRVQAHGLGLFFDEMINTFDPDALIVGGGAIETSADFQRWFVDEIRAGMPSSAKSRSTFQSTSCPMGDTPGARGAAIEAMKRMIL
jgi:predicted NBD/HSP70 family sugar kinase